MRTIFLFACYNLLISAQANAEQSLIHGKWQCEQEIYKDKSSDSKVWQIELINFTFEPSGSAKIWTENTFFRVDGTKEIVEVSFLGKYNFVEEILSVKVTEATLIDFRQNGRRAPDSLFEYAKNYTEGTIPKDYIYTKVLQLTNETLVLEHGQDGEAKCTRLAETDGV